jgi:hypothetical protein
LYAVSIAINIAQSAVELPALVGIVGSLCSIIATAALFGFLMKLAQYLDQPKLEQDAERLVKALMLVIVLSIGSGIVTAIFPLLGSLGFLVVYLIVIVTIALYAKLLWQLRRAIWHA